MSLSGIYAAIGPAGVVLALVACVGLFLALRTLLFLQLVWKEFKRDFLDVEQSSARNWNNVVNASDNPLVCVIRDIAQTHGEHSEDIRAEVAYLFHRNFARVTKSLCWIKLVSVVSPLLGLLGTVLGMVTGSQSGSARGRHLGGADHHHHGAVHRHTHAHVLLLSHAQVQGIPRRGRGTQLPRSGTLLASGRGMSAPEGDAPCMTTRSTTISVWTSRPSST